MSGISIPHILPKILDPSLEFEKYANLLAALIGRRNRWREVESRPLDITIDLATACNLRCPYCGTGNGTLTRPRKILHVDEHEEIMRFCGGQTFVSWYFSNGEPLLNKHFREIVGRSKRHEIFSIISTNLSIPLSDRKIDEIILSGLNVLSASVDGVSQETYAKYRVGGDYDLVIGNLRRIIARKRALGSLTPLIQWRFLVFKHNQHEMHDVLRVASELGVDLIEFHNGSAPADAPPHEVASATLPISVPVVSGPAIEWGKQRRDTPLRSLLRDTPTVFRHARQHDRNRKCDWLYFGSMFYPQGAVGPCCVVGNTDTDFGKADKNTPYADIWNNDRYVAARDLFNHGNTHKPTTICAACPIPDAQDYFFRISLQAYLLNAPEWFLRIVSSDPDRFFYPVDFSLIPRELDAIREHSGQSFFHLPAGVAPHLRSRLGEASRSWTALKPLLRVGGSENRASGLSDRPGAPDAVPRTDGDGSIPAAAAPEISHKRLHEQAERLILAGQRDGARQILLNLAAADAAYWGIYNDLGVLALNDNDVETAVSFLRRAVDLEKNSCTATINLAAAYMTAGDYERALLYFGSVIRQAPGRHDVLAAVREILCKHDRLSPDAWARLVADIRASAGGDTLEHATADPQSASEPFGRPEESARQAASADASSAR